jgi:hypothetical protein
VEPLAKVVFYFRSGLWDRVTGKAVILCVWKKTTVSQEMPVKLRQAISWLMGNLQGLLFHQLQECWDTPLTQKKRQLVSMLKLIRVEAYVPQSASNKCFGIKLLERESIATSFVAKAVYGFTFTRSMIEALKASSNLRHISGFKKVMVGST